MLQVGVQPQLLAESGACIEVLRVECTKQGQLKANQALVVASGNSLAPVSGNERFLTVANSHTAAFLKAVQHGCKENEESAVVDAKSDPGLLQLCTEGWPFTVLKAEVEEKWPSLPAWLQISMNCTNASCWPPSWSMAFH